MFEKFKTIALNALFSRTFGSIRDISYNLFLKSRNSHFGKRIYIDRTENLKVGNNVLINDWCRFHTGGSPKNVIVSIGENTYIGPGCTFITYSHKIGSNTQRAGKNIYQSINIEDGCWLGANVTVLPNVTISRGGVIGAGAVVTKTTEKNALYVGIPARKIKDL